MIVVDPFPAFHYSGAAAEGRTVRVGRGAQETTEPDRMKIQFLESCFGIRVADGHHLRCQWPPGRRRRLSGMAKMGCRTRGGDVW
ncbi:MAG: hypothetical protein Ct9H300mP1_06680 [Planctomycetaceae bacterium]|nr:MAG: hypothetical protein Ct9H300mP1_06680 [Planctomycetaceae bacterium]